MPMFEKLFKNKKRNCTAEAGAEVSPARPSAPVPESILSNNLMIVQLAAYYTAYGDEIYKKTYLEKTETLGIPKTEAVNIFNFECDVCKKYNKEYLLNPDFVKVWFMDLQQPFFLNYPKTQDEVCKEFFFTIGEVSKFLDEAEWHYWNSHERELTDEVWEEIFSWRLQGKGGMYVVDTYLPAICEKYSVSMDSFSKLVNHYGTFLSRYKWG